jgi:hypothetical protein
MAKRFFDLVAGMVILFCGMLFIGIAYLISNAAPFTLDKDIVGILGILLLASGGWLFIRRP